MDDVKIKDSIREFEAAMKGASEGTYILRLFITGMTPASMRAIENIRAICRDHLQGRFELEVIDIYKHPELAKEAQILASPTLIKKLPLPLRRFIGDLSDVEKILAGLDVVPGSAKKEEKI